MSNVLEAMTLALFDAETETNRIAEEMLAALANANGVGVDAADVQEWAADLLALHQEIAGVHKALSELGG